MINISTVFSPVCWIQLPSCTICGVAMIIIRVFNTTSFVIELCPFISYELAYGRQQDSHEFLMEFQEGILKKLSQGYK